MKKIVFGVIVFFLIFLATTLYLSCDRIAREEVYYTIPQNYSLYYMEDRKLSINVYSTAEESLIAYPEENQYRLYDQNNYYLLNNIYVEKQLDYSKMNEKITKYTLFIPLSNYQDCFIIENCSLEIKNDQFTLMLDIGYLRIDSKEYELLEFSDLYGNYAYMNGELHMVGITICLDEKYKYLESLTNGNLFGRLEYAEKNNLYASEIDFLDLKCQDLTSPFKQGKAVYLNAKSNYYFIPVGYEKMLLTINPYWIFKIDGKEYMLDNFIYFANDISLFNYPFGRTLGVLKYA